MEKKPNRENVMMPQTLLYNDACIIIEQAQTSAYRAVNETLIKRNWLLGMRIQHEVLNDQRAEYGEQVVKALSEALSKKYGEGFTKTNLYNYIGFYQTWPEFFHAASGDSLESDTDYIFHALSGKSENIVNALRPQSTVRLSWTHYRKAIILPLAYCFVPTPMRTWLITRCLTATTNFMRQNISLICPRKKNCVVK